MAGKQVSSDIPPSLAGMSKNQLYDIMSQMKTLIEQNKPQARQILIQNPALTKALFQAQIMLGMVQSPQAAPVIPSPASANSLPPAIPNQQANIQAASSFPSQTGPNQSQSMTLHTLQPIHQPKGHPGAALPTISVPPQSSQVSNMTQLPQHIASEPSRPQAPNPMHALSQQSMQNTGGQYTHVKPPIQTPLPPQQRLPMQGFPQQPDTQMGQMMGFQHATGSQLHQSQHMFHPGTKPSGGLGPSFPQGQLPIINQPSNSAVYQAGSPHLGMEFNQVGGPKLTDRGSSWASGLPEITIGQPHGLSSFTGQAGPSNQPPRSSALSPELEKALLQQVMSLTPEQINALPIEQRTQVLQLQQMLRQ